MKKFVIEREISGVGTLNLKERRAAAQRSNAALRQLGTDIQWVHSYVAGEKTFCIYLAINEEIIHEHARLSGFPATKITEIRRMMDPTTAAAVGVAATETARAVA